MGLHFALLVIFATALCVLADDHYTNEFAVEIDAPLSRVKRLAEKHNFKLVHEMALFGNIYHFQHSEVSHRSKRSADSYISRLLEEKEVKNVDQQKILIREKRGEILHRKTLDVKTYKDKSVFQRYPQYKRGDLVEKGLVTNRKRCDFQDIMNFNDPYFCDQWYLVNRGQTGGIPGFDVNVLPAWQQGYSGRGVVVSILDDGVYHRHPDLRTNYDPDASYDFNSHDNDPTPNTKKGDGNKHGTRCAGEIAAEANNSVCGVGIAYNAKIGGMRVLDGVVTDLLEAQALNYKQDHVHVYSASWGPKDDGKTLSGPHPYTARAFRQGVRMRILDGKVTDLLEAHALLYHNNHIDVHSASWGPRDDGTRLEAPPKHTTAALKEGVLKGRNGLGSIFVWATGNGGAHGDSCSCDGYVSSVYTISIGCVNDLALSTYFSEHCPSTLAVITNPGSHSEPGSDDFRNPSLKIVTTDVGVGCTENFVGTSAAAPLAAGLLALVLEANMKLTWRDVQYIIVNTARVPNPDEPGWNMNGNGRHVNARFGFGMLDCAAMVALAQNWTTVPEQHVCDVKANNPARRLHSRGRFSQTLHTGGCAGSQRHLVSRLEHVQLHVELTHTRRGDVNLLLESPSGTKSTMLQSRFNDDSDKGIFFTFMTVHNWGEKPAGHWTLTVIDNPGSSGRHNHGRLISWSLTLYGIAVPEEADTAPAPKENHKHHKSSQGRQDVIKNTKKSDGTPFTPDRQELSDIVKAEKQRSEHVMIHKLQHRTLSDADYVTLADMLREGRQRNTYRHLRDHLRSIMDKSPGTYDGLRELVEEDEEEKTRELRDWLPDTKAEGKRQQTAGSESHKQGTRGDGYSEREIEELEAAIERYLD